MATTKTIRFLSNLTLQSHRQRAQIGHRLAQHPTTALSLLFPTRSSSVEGGAGSGSSSENAALLVPALARWDDWDSDLDPARWTTAKKILATVLVTQVSWLVQFASAVDAAVVEGIEAEFGVGQYVSALATGIFLIGFALGAPIAGPLSESTGRNPVYILSLLLFLLATLTAAPRPFDSLPLFLLARFSAGLFGSTPLVCAGGTISDLWSPRDQLIAFPLYAAGGFSGLAAGPAAAGMTTMVFGIDRPEMTEWLTASVGACLFIVIALLQPETYAPVLLKWKTGLIVDNMKPEERDLVLPRMQTTERSASVRTRRLLQTFLAAFARPMCLALHEPIVLILSLNLSLLYAIVFTLLPGYVSIFTFTYSFTPAARGLAFYGLAVGFLLALLLALAYGRVWRRIHHASPALDAYNAEQVLCFAMFGALAIPAALFWMGWTARLDISPWSPLAASVLLGFGVLCVFISSYMYIIHAYGRYAASGLVFVTLTRYLLAGGMVVAGIGLFERLGVPWALTVLGVVGFLLMPVPYLLVAGYGKILRRGSSLSVVSRH